MMSKKKSDPALMLYTADFMMGTLTMSFEDRGKYITILCTMHQQGRLSEKAIQTLVGDISDTLREKFRVDEEGKWYNYRLEAEVIKRRKFSEHQTDNVNKRWNTKMIPNEYQNEYESDTNGIPLENENENINDNENKKKKREELLKKREEEFRNLVFECDPLKYSQEMLEQFCSYWTEKNRSMTKMRFEMQPIFEIRRRLATWASRDKDFNKIQHEEAITYKELLRRFNAGETDMWDKYERVIENGKQMWKRKRNTG